MSCQVINNKTIMCSSNHQFKKAETLIMLNKMIYIYIYENESYIYVTNHTYVQFKVAKRRLSGLLMLLLLFFHFLFCVGASFLIIIILQYCGHLSKQEVNYMGVCLCHCVTIFFTARHYIWFTQSVSFQEN